MGLRLNRLSRTKAIGLVLSAIGLVLLLHWLPLSVLFDPNALIQHIDMETRCSACLFVMVQIVATLLGLPGTILVIAGGVLYGLVWGTIWSTIGATLGAIAAFCMARYLLHDWVERWFGRHKALQRLHCTMRQNSLSCVLAIRFTPISPFNVMNFLLGLTPIGLKPYALGTFIGIIPGTIAYTGLGVSGRKALEGEGVIYLGITMLALMLLSLAPVLIKTLRRA